MFCFVPVLVNKHVYVRDKLILLMPLAFMTIQANKHSGTLQRIVSTIKNKKGQADERLRIDWNNSIT